MKHKRALWQFCWLSIGLVMFSTGCGGTRSASEEAVFLAPTGESILPPGDLSGGATPTPISLALQPTVIPPCSENLTYLEDMTIPDGMVVEPGSLLDKRWRVKNSGSCNWDEGYRLKLVSGSDLGAPAEQALYPARGGTEFMVRVLFIAPNEAGTYQSAWQAFDPYGVSFGDPFFIEIVVEQTASLP